jgi:DNA-binding transcriptional LysR family regulator
MMRPKPSDLNDILVFATVVRVGSFVGAARELAMPKSTVSRKVSELEARLGARLLQRTTRTLGLTDVGQTFYKHAARVVAELEEAERSVHRMQDVPRGLLRLTAPLNFGWLAPIVATFMERFPEVQIDLLCADRVVDLVQEGFDIGLRVGRLADSTLVARNLGKLESFVVASPDFLDRHGAPKQPSDLEALDCIVFGAGPDRTHWTLVRGYETETVTIRPRLVVNDFDFLDAAARTSIGVTLLPAFRCIADLRADRLRRVLPDWCTPATPLHVVYPSTRHLSPAIKAFLEHVQQRVTPPPWELGPMP